MPDIMKVLSDKEVTSFLGLHLKNWKFAEGSINREFKFKNFVDAFSFMTAIAFEAEKMDHHPNWSNTYNTVSIKLSTHKPEGITQADMELALKIDAFFQKFENK
jgi:4a-hydroxytetrahydrobiopterin dehydratase